MDLVIESFALVKNKDDLAIIFTQEHIDDENMFYQYATLVGNGKSVILPNVEKPVVDALRRKRSVLLVESNEAGDPVRFDEFDYERVELCGI